MSPPGRRRGEGGVPSILFCLLAIFTIFPGLVGAVSSSGVIGLDLGTEYIKAVLVQPGIPLEIVLTKDSKRKESASVAFRPSRDKTAIFPERFYGSDALALAPRFPEDVYSNLKTLLGVPFEGGVQGPDTFEDNIVEMYTARYPYMKLEGIAGRGTVGFKSDRIGGKDGEMPFMVEELLAMQLKQIKANAEALGGMGTVISDAVITFPSFYTAEEKRSVQLAADLAGLNVLSLMSDGLAVGLNYATSRVFPSVSDGQKPEYHVVFDMGAGSTTASVLKFQSRKVKDIGRLNKTVQEVYVAGTGWDKTLGGDALNKLIVDDIIAKFIASGKAPASVTEEAIRKHGRTMARLWKESERLRQILSANSETSASFETLASEDVNFRYKITRADFEELTAGHIERMSKPLNDALQAAGLTFKDIESIILHGGASRTPSVQKALEAACNNAALLRTNVNADEAAVFGAAFKGAELSPAFRVKEIRTYDTPSFAFGMKWQVGDHERQQKLFTPTSRIGAEKQITVKNLDDFEFRFFQQFNQKGQLTDVSLDSVQTQNLTKSVAALKDKFGCNASDISTKFSVRLRPVDGLPEVIGGSVSCEVVEKKNVIDGVKGFFGLGKKSEQTPLENMAEESITLEESATTTTTATATATTASTPAASDASTSSSTAASTETDSTIKSRREIIPLAITVTPLNPKPIPATELLRVKDRLSAFDASDFARVKREETFNTLESSIYRSRDLLDDDEFANYISPTDIETLSKRVTEASEWIEGDGADAPTDALQEKLDGLRRLINPALRRKSEAKARDDAVSQLQIELSNAASMVKLFDTQIEMYEVAAAGRSTAQTASTPSASASTISFDKNGDVAEESDSMTASPSSSATPSSSRETETPLPPNPIDAKDRDALDSVIGEITTWLETNTEKQAKKADSEDPVLTVSELREKTLQLQRETKRVMEKLTMAVKEGTKSRKSGGKKGKGKTSSSSSNSTAEKKAKESQRAEDKSVKDEL